jgi:hypothetical protein
MIQNESKIITHVEVVKKVGFDAGGREQQNPSQSK